MVAYAAQAAQVLLDAIARSDGTRASVTKELFATRVRGGILGTFGFDRNGDTTEQKVTILRPITEADLVPSVVPMVPRWFG